MEDKEGPVCLTRHPHLGHHGKTSRLFQEDCYLVENITANFYLVLEIHSPQLDSGSLSGLSHDPAA